MVEGFGVSGVAMDMKDMRRRNTIMGNEESDYVCGVPSVSQDQCN